MIILLKDVKKMLTNDLSVTQRGLLITALLCNDKIKEVALAKFKLFVNIKQNKEDLIFLHENKYIIWSGYKSAKRSIKPKQEDPKLIEVANFMRTLYGVTAWGIETAIWKTLRARIKDYETDELKLVVSNRWEKWKDDSEMKQNLNPLTIFRPSLFEKYLQEANSTGIGKGILSVSKLDLKDGDEITPKLSLGFVNSDLYTFKTYLTDVGGNKKGNGKLETKSGKDIKVLLNIQKNSDTKQFIYIFVQR